MDTFNEEILNQDGDFEAMVALLESRLDRALTADEEQKVRFVAGISDDHMINNLFEQMGSLRQDN